MRIVFILGLATILWSCGQNKQVENENIEGNYSLKPTMFGLLIDEEVCYENIREIVKKASEYGNFVRVDMEDSQCIDKEIKLFKRLKKEFPESAGLVFQAYMKRTLGDIKGLENTQSIKPNKLSPLQRYLCRA